MLLSVSAHGVLSWADVELIAEPGSVAACLGTLVARVRARLAVRQDVVLVADARRAARFRALVAVVVGARRAVLDRRVDLIAETGAVAAGGRALVAVSVARLAVGRTWFWLQTPAAQPASVQTLPSSSVQGVLSCTGVWI